MRRVKGRAYSHAAGRLHARAARHRKCRAEGLSAMVVVMVVMLRLSVAVGVC